MRLKKEKTKSYDQMRHALQAPVKLSSEPVIPGQFQGAKYRVLYLKNRRERATPWYYHRETARKALEVIKAKYGNAIIYVD